jgi:hypothetical protein
MDDLCKVAETELYNEEQFEALLHQCGIQKAETQCKKLVERVLRDELETIVDRLMMGNPPTVENPLLTKERHEELVQKSTRLNLWQK